MSRKIAKLIALLLSLSLALLPIISVSATDLEAELDAPVEQGNTVEEPEVKIELPVEETEGATDKTETVVDEANGEEGKVEGAEDKVEGAEDKVEGVENKVEDAENKVEGVENKVEDAEDKVENAENKVEGIEDKLEGAEGKIEGPAEVIETPVDENYDDSDKAEDEVETIVEIEKAEAVPGDYILSTNAITKVTIASNEKSKHAEYTMDTAGLLTFEFGSTTAAGNISISIKDNNDNIIWSNNWAVNLGSVTCSNFVEAGVYDLTFTKTTATDTNSYMIETRPIPSRTGELATRNNTQNNAGVLTLATEATGICSFQDVLLWRSDYYRFSLDQPGWVTINFTNKTMSPLDLSLYGDDTSTENEVFAFNLIGPACTDPNEANSTTVNHSGWLDAGVYYVVIDNGGPGSSNGRYALKVTNSPISITEKEKNNTFDLAYKNGNELSLIGARSYGLISESNNEDCYWFRLNSAADLSFSLKIQFTGINAAIYTRDGTLVPGSNFGNNATTGSDGNPATLEKTVHLEGGYYYLRLWWSAGQFCGKYDVTGYGRLTVSDIETFLTGADLRLNVIYTAFAYPVTIRNFAVQREDPLNPGSYYTIGTASTTSSDSVTFKVPGNGNYLAHAAVYDGTTWADLWKPFAIADMDPLKVESVVAKSDSDGNVTITAKLHGTNQTLAKSVFILKNGSTAVASYNGGNETSHVLKAPSTGTYNVEYWCTLDEHIWESGTTQVYADVPASLAFSALSFQVKSNGIVTATVSQKNGKPVTTGTFVFYSGSTVVASVDSGSKLEATVHLTPGTYTVGYAGSNGTWAAIWGTVTVPAPGPLTVTDLFGVSNAVGKVDIQASTSGGNGVGYGIFDIYSGSTLLKRFTTAESAVSWQAPASGTYTLHYAAYDGVTWADKWSSVTVSITPISTFSVTNLIATPSGNSIKCEAVTNDDRPIEGMFVLYLGGTEIQRQTTTKREYTFENLSTNTYTIQYAGTDGITWSGKWTSATIGTSLTINSVTTTTTGSILEVKANVSSSLGIKGAYMILYDAAGNEIARYEYQGSGDPLNHTFNIGPVAKTIHYVVFDGLEWKDKWQSV